MQTTAHKPYAKFEDGDIRPIIGFDEEDNELVPKKSRVPLVPSDGGTLVPADQLNGLGTKYEIIVNLPEDKEILHG